MKLCKPFTFLGILMFSVIHSNATNLTITNIRPVYEQDINRKSPSVLMDISWENSWNNNKNHDGVWLFVKFTGYWNNHAKLNATGHRVVQSFATIPPLVFVISPDNLGIMLRPAKNFRGNINCRIELFLDTIDQEVNYQKMEGLKAYGVEMVYIPQGPFTLGSPDEPAIEKAAFYSSDGSGNSDGLIRIDSEDPIPVGKEAGSLYYWSERALYNGDQQGPVPAAFPKGFNPFYVMKYELTQGQYADFLNSLYSSDTYVRSPFGGEDYYEHRGTIQLKNGKYYAEDPHRPMNYISWEDAMAYTDWAALRPITELEYTKAARGPETPIPFQMVWGTDHRDQLIRYINEGGSLVMTAGYDESMLTDETRPNFGASYYWVMDLSGSVWEKVITIGNELGRRFTGNHGDGLIRFGKANVEGWPLSNDEEGGFGYRGGGYYDRAIIGDFNPHSPIGYRYYGAWSGGPRSVAYGYRAGRSGW